MENKKLATTPTFTQKIGNTNYVGNIHFSETSKETLTDKVERDGTMAQASETMVKPLQAVKKMLIAMDNKSVHAVSRVDALSQRANRGKSQEGKPSVLQGLKDGKANTKEPTAPKPKSKEMEL